MIDWVSSNIIAANAKNADKVTTICEQCGTTKQVLYRMAKKREQHLCSSCVKRTTEHKHGELLEYVCIDCGLKRIQQFRASKFKNWRCHHCAMVQGHKDGKFIVTHNTPSEAGKLKLSELAKERWKDPECREKWAKTRKSTKAKRVAKSKEIWADRDRLTTLSETIKKAWERPDYRATKTEQSQKLWTDKDYIARQAAGMAKIDVKRRISEASLMMWANPEYRKTLMCHLRSVALRPSELSKITKLLNEQRWTDPVARERLMATFSSASFRATMRTINAEILSRPEVLAKLSTISKHRWDDPAYREKHAIARANMPRVDTKPQLLLYKLLDDLGVTYHREGPATRVGFYVWDCLANSVNGNPVLIDVQGLYWHSLPGAESRDKGKFTFTRKYHPQYEMMYVWEDEFACQGRVIDRLSLKLGFKLPFIDFDFRDVMVRDVRSSDVRSFLDAYHYIGNGRGGVAFGAFLGDELIGCVAYSPPLRQNTAGQFDVVDGDVRELSRLCIHPSYHKKNFASWLISKTVGLISEKLIISYADTTVGHTGTVYRASNFKLHHIVPSDYWYVDGDGYVMGKRTLYGKARSLSITEAEFADKFGYAKRWGGEKLCFIYLK